MQWLEQSVAALPEQVRQMDEGVRELLDFDSVKKLQRSLQANRLASYL
jgi:hypothetical protein